MLFDFLVTLIVHDAMNLSRHPITVFTKSFSIVLYPRCSCILIVNYTLPAHGLFYWVKCCVAEILGQELRDGSVFYLGEKANFFLNFLTRSLRLD